MWRGLYTAATGMITETKRTDTIANNLANANTTGYKRDDAVTSDFEPMLLRRINDKNGVQDVTSFKGFSLGSKAPVVGELGLGAQVADIATDYAQGSMQSTGNPLDFAIQGEGYFRINTAHGERYTRDGNFYRSADSRLVTVNGEEVLDTNGRPIIIPPENADFSVSPSGNITSGGVPVARLGLVTFQGGNDVMIKEGNSLYRVADPVQGNPPLQPQQATGSIQQGALERSNTEIVSEMVNMIANYRAYEASSKAVVTQDTLLDKAVNEVGRIS